MTTGVCVRKRGQSEPICAAIDSRSFILRGVPQSSFTASNALAPLELPPPSPAPAGTRFSSLKLKKVFNPVFCLKSSAAFITRFDESVGTPSILHSSESQVFPAAVSAIKVSPNFVGATRLRSSWKPSGRGPSMASIKFTLQGENFSTVGII